MAESADKESKTEEATEKKVRDSIEKGQIPFSKELPVLASFGAILAFSLFFAHSAAMDLSGFLSIFLEQPDAWPLETERDAVALFRVILIEIARAFGTILVLLMVTGIAASALQNMPRFVADRVAPKFSRISLAQGWKRLFGQQGWVEFAKSLAKLTFASCFVVFALSDVHVRMLSGMITNPSEFGVVIEDMLSDLLFAMIFVMILIAAVDFIWSRFHWRQDLRMTRQEVKDEMKQSEGDPIVKMRIRSVARDRARRRMISAVPTATLVIANPTHFAIALRYKRDEDAAPVVVAKGQDLIALRIREMAEANGIPVFEDVALARSMYDQVSVDSLIPPQFYQAVAELVRVVYGTANQKQRRDA